MADETTELLDPEEGVGESADETEAAAGGESAEPQVSELDKELRELGVSDDELSQIADDTSKQVLARRLKELTSAKSKAESSAADARKLLDDNKSKAELWDTFSRTPQFQKAFAKANERAGGDEDDIRIDTSSAEWKVLDRAFSVWLEQKGLKAEDLRRIPEVTRSNEQLRQEAANRELERLRSKFGDDWTANEDQIVEVWQRFPSMTGEEAFKFALADQAEVLAEKKLRAKQEEKKRASAGLSSTGVSSAAGKDLTLEQIREMDDDSFWKVSLKEAKRGLGMS